MGKIDHAKRQEEAEKTIAFVRAQERRYRSEWRKHLREFKLTGQSEISLDDAYQLWRRGRHEGWFESYKNGYDYAFKEGFKEGLKEGAENADESR